MNEKLTELLVNGVDAEIMLCGGETFYCYLTEYGIGRRGEQFCYGVGKTLEDAVNMAYLKEKEFDKISVL